MTSPWLGEFLGTMILILLGDGVVAAVLLKRSKAESGGWMVITAGWAFAVMAGVFTAIACGSSDAHLNPAVTLGFAVRDGNFAKLAPYFAAQMLGAMAGAALVWLHYLPHWKETPDAAMKLLCFSTAPAIRKMLANPSNWHAIATFHLPSTTCTSLLALLVTLPVQLPASIAVAIPVLSAVSLSALSHHWLPGTIHS